MIIPDANLLIYGFRSELPDHSQAQAWWKATLAGNESVGLHPLVECAFLRLMTKPLGPLPAAPMKMALDYCDVLRENPVVIAIHEGTGHRALFRSICDRYQLAGDEVNDTWLASLALEQNATLASADKGFGRFENLRWINPLKEND